MYRKTGVLTVALMLLSFLGYAHHDYIALKDIVSRGFGRPFIDSDTVTKEYLGGYITIKSKGKQLSFEVSDHIKPYFEEYQQRYWDNIKEIMEEKGVAFPKNTVIVYPILFRWVLGDKELRHNLAKEIDDFFPADHTFSDYKNVRIESPIVMHSYAKLH